MPNWAQDGVKSPARATHLAGLFVAGKPPVSIRFVLLLISVALRIFKVFATVPGQMVYPSFLSSPRIPSRR